MTIAQFESLFQRACDEHYVKVFFNDKSQEEDNGCAMWNEVHLAPHYSCLSVYKAVAFHELGHAVINMKRAKGIKLYKVHSSFNNEFNAWWLAQRLHLKYIGKPFNKKMGDFVLECLKSHSATHYAFKDIFKDYADQQSCCKERQS